MNSIAISLATKYDSAPAECKISCCGEVVFDGPVKEDFVLQKEIPLFDNFSISIVKKGKTLDMVHNKEEQVIEIKKIMLNGIPLKISAFGQFNISNNPYLKEERLQTNCLNLNGTWTLELPYMIFDSSMDIKNYQKDMRDNFSDCDVACFGCSQTYGLTLEESQTWPSHLADQSGLLVKNYGVPGSNINQIKCIVDKFVESHQAKTIIIYAPHLWRGLRGDITKIKRDIDWSDRKDLIMHGEEHTVANLAGKLKTWLDGLAVNRKILFGTYQLDQDLLYRKTAVEPYMIPFLQGEDYPKAPDGYHFGQQFNIDFAKILTKLIQKSQ